LDIFIGQLSLKGNTNKDLSKILDEFIKIFFWLRSA